ncbi:MAG TPA: type II secretion system F family protein [Thermodesulfobacteriaceae bacterium]|nr:type II secretion system F family protein [Thermodesulfobacteriaceae bacterium]
MTLFSYEAMDKSGSLVKEHGDFSSVEVLYNHLASRGLVLTRYRRKIIPPGFGVKKKITRLALAELLRNIALLIRGGVPVRQALEDMAGTHGDASVKAVIERITRRLDDGHLLSKAMEQESSFFPRITITLAGIGEETGNIDKSLNDAAEHLERIDEIISRTRRALIYPLFVLAAITGAMVFWMIYVLPQLLELFSNMGLHELPLATRILIGSQHIFSIWWPVLPIIILAATVFYVLSKKNSRVKYAWDLMMTRMPVLGSVIKASQLAFFFEYLSVLTGAGINIVRSLELMEQSVTHQLLKKGVLRIQSDVMSGESISGAFARVDFFEPFVLRMLTVGEQTGNMPEQLSIVADHYMAVVNKMVENLSKTMEPVIMSVAGVLFAIIVMGLLAPIYDLMGNIH